MSGRSVAGSVLAVFLALTARAAPVSFEVDTVEGKPSRGAIASLDDKWHLRLDGQEKHLPRRTGSACAGSAPCVRLLPRPCT